MEWVEGLPIPAPPEEPEAPKAAVDALFSKSVHGRGSWWWSITRDGRSVHVVNLEDDDPAATKRTLTCPMPVRAAAITADGLLAAADNTALHLLDCLVPQDQPGHLRSFKTHCRDHHYVLRVWFVREGRGLIVAYEPDWDRDYDENPFELTHVFGVRDRVIRKLSSSKADVADEFEDSLFEVDGGVYTDRFTLVGFDEAWEAELGGDPPPTEDTVRFPR